MDRYSFCNFHLKAWFGVSSHGASVSAPIDNLFVFRMPICDLRLTKVYLFLQLLWDLFVLKAQLLNAICALSKRSWIWVSFARRNNLVYIESSMGRASKVSKNDIPPNTCGNNKIDNSCRYDHLGMCYGLKLSRKLEPIWNNRLVRATFHYRNTIMYQNTIVSRFYITISNTTGANGAARSKSGELM